MCTVVPGYGSLWIHGRETRKVESSNHNWTTELDHNGSPPEASHHQKQRQDAGPPGLVTSGHRQVWLWAGLFVLSLVGCGCGVRFYVKRRRRKMREARGRIAVTKSSVVGNPLGV